MQIEILHSNFNSIFTVREGVQCLSWAPYTPAEKIVTNVATTIINHTVSPEWSETDLTRYCKGVVEDLGHDPNTSIVMLTAVPQQFLQQETLTDKTSGLMVRVFSTAGMGNALAPGDAAKYNEEVDRTSHTCGTINIVVFINKRLSAKAMLELSQVITMAKSAAMIDERVMSTQSDKPALGTGTDCMTIVSLRNQVAELQLAGMHTRLAELVAHAVKTTITRAISAQRGSK